MSLVLTALAAIYWILPAWVANGMPVIFGGGTPLDFGKHFKDGERIFGAGKTFYGLFFGILFGTIIGLLQGKVLVGFLLSVGALLGDLVGSFAKRRMGIEQGGSLPIVDQLGFVAVAMLLAVPVEVPPAQQIAAILVITLLVHWLANFAAYKLKLKSVPW